MNKRKDQRRRRRLLCFVCNGLGLFFRQPAQGGDLPYWVCQSFFFFFFFFHELFPDHVPKVSELCLIIKKKGKDTHAAMSRTCPTRAWQANCHVCALQYVYPIYMRYSSEIKFITYKKKFRSIATYVF